MRRKAVVSKSRRETSWTHRVECPPDGYCAGSHGKMAEHGFGHVGGVTRIPEPIREDQKVSAKDRRS